MLGITVANALFSPLGRARPGEQSLLGQTQPIHHMAELLGMKESFPLMAECLYFCGFESNPRSYLNTGGFCSSVLIIGQLQLFLWSCCWQHLSNLTRCGFLEHSLLTPTQRRYFKKFPLKFIQSKQIFFLLWKVLHKADLSPSIHAEIFLHAFQNSCVVGS